MDITVGNNIFLGQSGPSSDVEYCGQGFTASTGWDPVTGVGMMNFPAFVDAAKEYYCTGVSSPCPDPTVSASSLESNASIAHASPDVIALSLISFVTVIILMAL